jgi:C4-dicarboxylate-specific signal transduction histidine kinase
MMSLLGYLSIGAAHKMLDPLSGINVYLSILEKRYGRTKNIEEEKEILTRLQSASNEVASLAKKVIELSKHLNTDFRLTDINQIIHETVKLTSVSMRKNGIKIVESLAEHLPPCLADPHLIKQVILNLLTNASEAMEDNMGPKNIWITSLDKTEQVVVKVTDSGPGVDLGLISKIFDPFYTTKNDNLGIGLTVSHQIIKVHEGSIKVSKGKKRGAEFVIEMPIDGGNLPGVGPVL